MGYFYSNASSKPVRQNLKREMTEPEKRLWYFLRNRRLHGIKFRRQYSIGRYVVDFYCPSARLAIEIDGDSHYVDDAPQYDKSRQEFIEDNGIKVIRFTNQEVIENIEGVVQKITEVVPT